jgi:hypothetical protein
VAVQLAPYQQFVQPASYQQFVQPAPYQQFVQPAPYQQFVQPVAAKNELKQEKQMERRTEDVKIKPQK